MKKILFFSIIVMLVYACNVNKDDLTLLKINGGRLERIDSFQSAYVESRNVDVWLPENYNENEKYSVLYMHDGQMLFDSTNTWNKQEWMVDEIVSKLLEENKIKNTIVVGIWNINKNRHFEYCPQKPIINLSSEFTNYLIDYIQKRNQNEYLASIQSDNYLKFIVEELKPYIDKNYSTLSNMKNTFIAGSSMGGLISLYAICEYPEVFYGAACLSTHWTVIYTNENNPIPNTIVNYLEQNLPDPNNHKLYFDYGTETLDSLYETSQVKVDSILVKKGYSNENWVTLKFEGEDHSENAWSKRLHIPFKFLLSK